jgi:hypothetical protein
MPDSTTPEARPDAELVVEAELDTVSTDAVVYVIQSNYHYRDLDNHPKTDEELLDDEGWFADKASAVTRCQQLNAQNLAYYDTSMAIKKRAHDATIRHAEKKNLEAAAIRAAGLKKDDVPVPPAFVPETFEKFLSVGNHTIYEPVEIRRSDHDGIARAVATEDDSGSRGSETTL